MYLQNFEASITSLLKTDKTLRENAFIPFYILTSTWRGWSITFKNVYLMEKKVHFPASSSFNCSNIITDIIGLHVLFSN